MSEQPHALPPISEDALAAYARVDDAIWQVKKLQQPPLSERLRLLAKNQDFFSSKPKQETG